MISVAFSRFEYALPATQGTIGAPWRMRNVRMSVRACVC